MTVARYAVYTGYWCSALQSEASDLAVKLFGDSGQQLAGGLYLISSAGGLFSNIIDIVDAAAKVSGDLGLLLGGAGNLLGVLIDFLHCHHHITQFAVHFLRMSDAGQSLLHAVVYRLYRLIRAFLQAFDHGLNLGG